MTRRSPPPCIRAKIRCMARQSLLEWLDYFPRHARGPAFVQPRGLRREVWTYGQVFAAACRFGHELDARNIRKGHRLLLWGNDSAEWVAVFLGCMMRGVVVVPLDRVGSAGFVRRIFAEVDGKLLVCARGLSAQVTDVPQIILEDFPALVARHDAKPLYAELTREDPLQIIFTSGTTDEPKGVVTTHGNVLANLEPFEGEIAKYLRYERWFHPLRFLSLVPLSHVFGQFMGIFLPPLLGAVVVFPERVAPGEIQKTIRKERVSVLVAVPRMVESLQSHVERWTVAQHGEGWLTRQFVRAATERVWRRWWRFRSVHGLFGWRFWAIVSGGATLEPSAETFWSRIGIAILQGYGLTETTSLVSVNHPFRRGAGSIGKVLPGRDLKLSATGEIMVRGESIARNYWQGGKLTPLAGEDSGGEEGWLRTGDLGELDSEGFLHFKGREKNVIVTAEGMKVYPQDLENALRRSSGVRDAVVFGYARGGNAEPAAVLLLQTGASAEEVVRSVNQGLAPFQQIRHWYGWPDADFPRTSTQKPRSGAIQARALERFAGHAATSSVAGKAAGGGVAELIAQVRGRKSSGDANPGGDLGLSSLERVELICAVEDRYQIAVNETDFARVTTVGDLEKFISARPVTTSASAARYHYPRWALSRPMRWVRLFVYYLLTYPATHLLSGVKISGRENLQDIQGPVLVISNHVAYIDVGFVLAALPFRLRNRLAVAMEGERVQSLRAPQGGGLLAGTVARISYWLMTALFNVFPLPKASGFRESFAFAGSATDRGYNILVFPEGLRTRDGEIAPFRSGIGLLATGLRLPVVPMRIDGLWEVKQSGWRGVAPWGNIHVRIGAPVRFSADTEADAIARKLEDMVCAL